MVRKQARVNGRRNHDSTSVDVAVWLESTMNRVSDGDRFTSLSFLSCGALQSDTHNQKRTQTDTCRRVRACGVCVWVSCGCVSECAWLCVGVQSKSVFRPRRKSMQRILRIFFFNIELLAEISRVTCNTLSIPVSVVVA